MGYTKKLTGMIICFVILFLSGCMLNLDSLCQDLNCKDQNTIVCNAPYIRYETGCCLDTDINNICDKDEPSKPNKQYNPLDSASITKNRSEIENSLSQIEPIISNNEKRDYGEIQEFCT